MIKHADSHLDHGLSEAQVAYLIERFADRDSFFVEHVELPRELGDVPCGLYGPAMGDQPIADVECFAAKRTGRSYESRMVHRPVRRVGTVTVIAGPHDGAPCVLYTAFGGPPAPMEPLDPNLKPGDAAESSRSFWSQHALACTCRDGDCGRDADA